MLDESGLLILVQQEDRLIELDNKYLIIKSRC